MALLDLQGMELPAEAEFHRGKSAASKVCSGLSLLLC